MKQSFLCHVYLTEYLSSLSLVDTTYQSKYVGSGKQDFRTSHHAQKPGVQVLEFKSMEIVEMVNNILGRGMKDRHKYTDVTKEGAHGFVYMAVC